MGENLRLFRYTFLNDRKDEIFEIFEASIVKAENGFW